LAENVGGEPSLGYSRSANKRELRKYWDFVLGIRVLPANAFTSQAENPQGQQGQLRGRVTEQKRHGGSSATTAHNKQVRIVSNEEPTLTLADEPTGDLDNNSASGILEILKKLNERS
jgi:hypothetical protein